MLKQVQQGFCATLRSTGKLKLLSLCVNNVQPNLLTCFLNQSFKLLW